MRLLITVLIRLLALIAIVWVLKSLWRVLRGQRTANRASRSAKPAPIAVELKKDPICGTCVSEATSLKSRYRGEYLYFCSRDCQKEFLRTHPTTLD